MAKITQIARGQKYELPQEALCLGTDGWLEGQLQLVQIVGRGLTLQQTVDMVWEQSKGLLGAGDLQFVTDGTQYQDPQGTAYEGFIVFLPEPDAT